MQSLASHCLILFCLVRSLKEKIKQQVYPKSSITKAYFEVERTFFASYYFGSNVRSMRNRCRKNKDGDEHNFHFSTLSVFKP